MWDALRSEIVENHKARVDLVKWKLLVIAAIVGWSLDAGIKNYQQLSLWAISLTLWACLFVDSHCFHLNLRTFVIGHFLRLWGGDESQYEIFVHSLRIEPAKNGASSIPKFRRGDIFLLEQGALTLSMVAVCFGVMFWPIIAVTFPPPPGAPAHPVPDSLSKGIQLIFSQPSGLSGFCGLIASAVLMVYYLGLKTQLVQDADNRKSQDSSISDKVVSGPPATVISKSSTPLSLPDISS
jgi:hypothetical protein